MVQRSNAALQKFRSSGVQAQQAAVQEVQEFRGAKV
jgi:hypothetical protein